MIDYWPQLNGLNRFETKKNTKNLYLMPQISDDIWWMPSGGGAGGIGKMLD